MIQTQHPKNNAVLGPPEGMTNQECRPLPVTLGVYADGTNSIKSYWKPTEGEMETLRLGGYVTLEILGTVHPPVIIGVEK